MHSIGHIQNICFMRHTLYTLDTLAYMVYTGYQGRSDDSDTAHSADTDRQWHRHHHTPALPPPLVSEKSHGICTKYKSGPGQSGGQLLHSLHTSYATCHITPTLRCLHWLKITEHIEYKLFSLTYNSSQPPNLHTCISSPLFNLLAALALHLSSLAQPPTSFSSRRAYRPN